MTVSGLKPGSTKSGYSLSDEALRALQCGDTQALIDSHRHARGWRMEDDGDDGDGDDSGDKDDQNDKDDKKDTDDSGDGGDDGDKDDAGSDDDAKAIKAELERVKKRMSAADQRAAKAEKALKEQEDAKKDDLTKATDRVKELESEVTELKGTLQSERLNNAFLSANKHAWHKPSAALKLAQSEGYLDDVVGEDGTVDEKALGSALSKLAKDNEYLIKKEGSGQSGESGKGRSGNGKDDKVVKEQDRRRAPALNRRR